MNKPAIPLNIHLHPANEKLKKIDVVNGKLDYSDSEKTITIYNDKYKPLYTIKNVRFFQLALTGTQIQVALYGTIDRKKYFVFTNESETSNDGQSLFSEIDINVAFSGFND